MSLSRKRRKFSYKKDRTDIILHEPNELFMNPTVRNDLSTTTITTETFRSPDILLPFPFRLLIWLFDSIIIIIIFARPTFTASFRFYSTFNSRYETTSFHICRVGFSYSDTPPDCLRIVYLFI